VDLAPTIAELLGVAAPDEGWEGRSLVPLMRPESRAAQEARDAAPVFSELTREHGTQAYQAITWHGWKYIRHHQTDPEKTWEHLFDLQQDPGEQHNLLESTEGEAPAMLGRLRDQLHEFATRNVQARAGLGEATGGAVTPEQQLMLEQLGYTGTSKH